MKRKLVEVINRDRKAAGLRAVEFSEEYSSAADVHCREMVERGYVSHWNLKGWKPYLRYTELGIRDYTAENIWSLWDSAFHETTATVEAAMLAGHQSFMAQIPPMDAHKRNILNPHHTHVGIGVAYDARGLRLLELFGAGYAELKPLPVRVRLDANMFVEGRVSKPGFEIAAISIYYELLPAPMSIDQLRQTLSYGLPAEEQTLTVWRGGFPPIGNTGSVVETNLGRGFRAPIRFWKKLPGVYTVSIWVRQSGEKTAFLGAQQSIIVGEEPKPIRPHGPDVSMRPLDGW
jgi:hypothetical protein